MSRTSTVAPVPTTTSSFNTNDQLGGDTYDLNGSTAVSAGKTYVYDFENRIKSVNSGQIIFVYDGDGNRVAKTIGGVTTKFLVDTNSPTGYTQVVEEIIGSSVQRVYEHGHSLITQTQLISGNWVPSFYGYDGHGSVRALTDTTGAITDTYTYDAFGNVIASTGSTPNNYLYAGEQFDADLGLYYLRARYLNATSGRFLTGDSFEGDHNDPRMLHKYLYALADPVNQSDPLGFAPFGVGWAVSVAVGIAVHEYLYENFESRGPNRETNVAISTLLKKKQIALPTWLNVAGLLTRPDLVDVSTETIFEIKPQSSLNAGRLQQVGYLFLLHQYDPTGRWWFGNPEIYTPPSTFRVLADTIEVEAAPPDVYGVITYDWDFHVPRLDPPPLPFIVAAAVTAMMASIMYQMMLPSTRYF